MTVARFLLIFYTYAPRFERFRAGRTTDADVVALKKEEDAWDARP